MRTRVSLTTKIPAGWENFLRHDDNKTELFRLLALSIEKLQCNGVTLCSTLGDSVILSPKLENLLEGLAPCNHEEADTRLFVHVANAVKHGHRRVMVRTCDTDVVVIAVSCFHRLPSVEELWVHLKAGKKHTFLAIHEVAASLGKLKQVHSKKKNFKKIDYYY